MKGKWLSFVVLAAAAAMLLNSASCGHSQELVSIQIQPSVETVGASDIPVNLDAGQQVQLRALGSYVHPPVSKDITNQVTWASNTPQMFTVTSGGLLTATGQECGGTLVSATLNTNADANGLSASGAIVTGYMTANVVCYTGSGGGGSGDAALTVAFQGNGSGTVSFSPQGPGCTSPAPCVGDFIAGTTVTLTAAPTGSSVFGGWQNCETPASTNPCMVSADNQTVIVTFN